MPIMQLSPIFNVSEPVTYLFVPTKHPIQSLLMILMNVPTPILFHCILFASLVMIVAII